MVAFPGLYHSLFQVLFVLKSFSIHSRLLGVKYCLKLIPWSMNSFVVLAVRFKSLSSAWDAVHCHNNKKRHQNFTNMCIVHKGMEIVMNVYVGCRFKNFPPLEQRGLNLFQHCNDLQPHWGPLGYTHLSGLTNALIHKWANIHNLLAI